MNAKGGFAAAESYAWHRYLIVSQGRRLRSPRLTCASCAAKRISAADYIDLLNARRSLIARIERAHRAL